MLCLLEGGDFHVMIAEVDMSSVFTKGVSRPMRAVWAGVTLVVAALASHADAQGALRAVRFLAAHKTGMFDMFDVLGLGQL